MTATFQVKRSLTALCFIISIWGSAAFAQNYTIQPLGLLPNMDIGWGEDVNNKGHVVGWCRNTATIETVGFFWSAETGYQSFPAFGDDVNQSYGQGINESDTTVGYQIVSPPSDYYGLVYHDKTLSLITDWGQEAPGDIYMSCRDINDNGVICGTTKWFDGEFVATRVTNGQHHNLGRYSTDDFSSAHKINNLNHIIGRSWNNPSPDRQVFWNGASWSVLPTLGGMENQFYDLNDSDMIVGYSYLAGDSIAHACYWLNGGGDPVDIGTLGGNLSLAQGVNNSGHIVGISHYMDNVNFNGFLYRDGMMHDVFDLLPPGTPAEWSLINPRKISDNGYITGYGTFNGMEEHPFIMIPDPPPGTIAHYDFDGGPQGWTALTDIPPFQAGASSTPNSAIALSPANGFPVFAFWQSPEIEVEMGKTYKAQFIVTSTVLDADDVPQFRLRVIQVSNNLAWFTAADSVGGQPPAAGETQTYEVVFSPSMDGPADAVRLSLDLTYFNPEDDGAGTIIIQEVTVVELE